MPLRTDVHEVLPIEPVPSVVHALLVEYASQQRDRPSRTALVRLRNEGAASIIQARRV